MNRFGKIAVMLSLALTLSLVMPDIAPAFVETVEAEAAVKMNTKKLSLKVGQKYTLKIKGSAKAFNWTSSDKSVAKAKRVKKYKNRCVVTAVSEGTAVIIATKGSKSYTCTVTVTAGSGSGQKNTNTPTPTEKPAASVTPKPTATAAPVSSDTSVLTPVQTGNASAVVTDSNGNYIPFAVKSSITGNIIYSEANKSTGYVRDYDSNGKYTETKYSGKCYDSAGSLSICYDDADSNNNIVIFLTDAVRGKKYEYYDFKLHDYNQFVAVYNGNWYGMGTYGYKGASTSNNNSYEKFVNTYVECYANESRTKAYYYYISVLDDSGKKHEIDGIFVDYDEKATPAPTGTARVTSTPTPTPKPAATLTPTPTPRPVATATPTPTPRPVATATPTPAVAAHNTASRYTSPYTGNTFEVKDGYTSVLFKRTAAPVDESKVKLLLPSYESFMGGAVAEKTTIEHDTFYEKSFEGDFEQMDSLKEYIDLLTTSYDMKQEHYHSTYGTSFMWGFKYNGTAGIDKGKVEYSYSDLYGYDLLIDYYHDYVTIYYPKDVEFVYTSDAATGKEALDASIESLTMEKTSGKELYFYLSGWSDHAGDSISVFLPNEMFSMPAGTMYSYDQITSGDGHANATIKDITGVNIANSAVSNGKNSKFFKDFKVGVVEKSDEAFNVYYYIKLEANSGVTYEFEGVRATERLSAANFKGNGQTVEVKNGGTVYYPTDGTTYVIDKGSTITIEGPFATEGYKDLYGYSFLPVQKGIIDVNFNDAKNTFCTVKGSASGEAIMKIGLVGAVSMKHTYQLKYGNQRINYNVKRLEPRSDEIMIKIKVR